MKKIQKSIKNTDKKIHKRLLIAMIPLFVVVICCYIIIPSYTYVKFNSVALMQAANEQNTEAQSEIKLGKDSFYEKSTLLKTKIKKVAQIIKLPTNLFNYNIWVKNDTAATANDRGVNLIFRTDINDEYKEVKSGEKEKIPHDNFPMYKFDHSLNLFYKDNGEKITPGTEIEVECKSSISVFLRPTFLSFFIALAFSIIFYYGFLLLAAGYYKFILHGRPFTEK